MTHYTDSKFDAIRKLSASELTGIRLGWSGDAAIAELVKEYHDAIDAENKAELVKIFKSRSSRYNQKDRNHYL